MIHISVDLTELEGLLRLDKTIEDGVSKFTKEYFVPSVYAHVMEEANHKLHSRREMFIDGLSIKEEQGNVWSIVLDAKVRWIDDGISEHNMIEDLLKSKSAKTSAKGTRYLNVPFKHGPQGSAPMTQAQSDIFATIKRQLNDKSIPINEIEKNPDGSDKLGLIHKVDLQQHPIRPNAGRGYGKGPIGAIAQSASGRPILQGLKIYQLSRENKTTKQKETHKFIVTFRTVSSSQDGKGLWDHPGLPPAKIFEDTVKWANEQYENVFFPKLLHQLTLGI